MSVNIWLIAAAVLVWCLVPCGIVCFRGDAADRLVGLEMADAIYALVLLLIAEGLHRLPFFDLALALALLAFGGGLVFVRFMERYL